MTFFKIIAKEFIKHSWFLLFLFFAIFIFSIVYISIPLWEKKIFDNLILNELRKEKEISENVIDKIVKYAGKDSLTEKLKDTKFIKYSVDLLEILNTKDTNYVYSVALINNQSYILIDASKEDRMNPLDIFEFLPEELPVIHKAILSLKPQYKVINSINTVGITFYYPFKDKKNTTYLLVIDYNFNKIKEINDFLSVIRKVSIFFIILTLIIFNTLIFFIIKTSYYKRKSFIDSLTNIYNKNYLEYISELTDLKNYIVAAIDIDFFKKVNDTYGHAIGDIVLRTVAENIKKNLREEDILIRYGGEEFVILVRKERKNKIEIILNVFERLRENIENLKIFITEKDYIKVTISIGVFLNTDKEKSLYAAIKKADIALYKSKSKGRNRIEIYDEEKDYINSLITITEVKNAVDENKIFCYYQPIIDLKTNLVSHYEALVRMEDKNGNIITPYSFLTAIEHTFVYTKLTKAVIDYNIEILKKYSDIKVSINLKPADILNRSTVDYLVDIAKNKDIVSRLFFEIIETEDLLAYEEILKVIGQLKKVGYKICLDDFGSGYSNFVYLLRLNIDYLKLDANLIKNINTDKVSFEVVKLILQFCKNMKIKTIAEFAENEDILNVLRYIGIDYGQGYYFSKPKPIEEFINQAK